MAVHKTRATHKSKKEIVRKHINHKALKKKVAEEEKPQLVGIQQDVLKAQQAPVSESVVQPTVIPSGVLQDTIKDKPQPEPELPKVETQQATDTLTSQPVSAISSIPNAETTVVNNVEPEGNIAQNPLAVNGLVEDKPEENIDDSKKKHLWIIIAIAIFLVLIGGALWYFRENVMKRAPIQDEVTPIPSVLKNTPTPATDSAKLEIDFSEYKIKVLNGSGISGEAAKVKELLEAEEFLIEEIGNADNTNYEGTIIRAKKEVPNEFLDKLKIVLEETYLLDTNEELEDSEEMDVIIIIGSGKQP